MARGVSLRKGTRGGDVDEGRGCSGGIETWEKGRSH